MRHAPPCPHRHPDAVRLRTIGRRRRRCLGLRLGRGGSGGLRSRRATQQATEHGRHLAAGGMKEGVKVVRVANQGILAGLKSDLKMSRRKTIYPVEVTGHKLKGALR